MCKRLFFFFSEKKSELRYMMQNYLNVREKMNLAHNEFPNACET